MTLIVEIALGIVLAVVLLGLGVVASACVVHIVRKYAWLLLVGAVIIWWSFYGLPQAPAP
jgi:hypothetical protein